MCCGVARAVRADVLSGRDSVPVVSAYRLDGAVVTDFPCCTEDLARALDLSVAALLTPQARSRQERIALVGLRGAGKTTIGRALALHLKRPFVELDARL